MTTWIQTTRGSFTSDEPYDQIADAVEDPHADAIRTDQTDGTEVLIRTSHIVAVYERA